MKKVNFSLLALIIPFFLSFGKYSIPPVQASVKDASTALNVPPGFEVDLIYEVDRKKFGSWISMAFDKKGRLTVSDQQKAGTFLVEIPKPGQKFDETKIKKLSVESSVYGMLYAFDHLYMMGNRKLTRAKVLPDGSLGPVEFMAEMAGGGEHGPHSIIISPDGKSIYVIAGNATKPPEFINSRIPTNWKDDVLLENYAYGHMAQGKAPGGWVMKMSPDGKNREIITMGFRNPCDFALNRDGELFVYDADMEYDIGSPWYRPTRINHGISGGDSGWRATSKKWRDYFPDTVGSVVDVGPGSPTGVIAGINANFPTHYRDALFICDWTFATMYSIHLKPSGSTYIGEKREFVSNSDGSLALTDVVIGPDGNMYFCVGGRGGQSYLYRITYTGSESTELSQLDTTSKHAKARATRRKLESFHGSANKEALAVAWPHLGSEDYHIRYAARIAIEWQSPKSWAQKAYSEKNDVAAIHALLGLARSDYEGSLKPSVERLLKIDFKELDKSGQLALLRTYSVIMSRAGMPERIQAHAIGEQLDLFFPSNDNNLNEELCRVLCYLDHPSVVRKTVALMKTTKAKIPNFDTDIMKRNKHYGSRILSTMDADATPNILNIHLLFCLKGVQVGWTMEDRKAYLGELQNLMTKKGGNMFTGYIQKIRESAIASVPDKDRISLQYLMGEVKSVDLAKLPKAKGPGVAWTVDSGLKVLNEEPLAGRSFANGQKMFSAGLCVACHRFGNEGGGVGPDLTNLAKRSDYKSILESTIHPNMVVSEQFEQHELKMKDGSITMGRVVTEEDGEYGLVQSGLQPLNLTKIKKSKVASKNGSSISMMPGGLINSMNAEELKDLIAYFVSAGDRKHKVFRSLKKLKVELISALYGEDGNPKRQMDIKSKIQKELDRMQYDFSMTNKLAGKDPAGGVVKTLNLKYKLNGKTYSKKIRENGAVSFND
ncbi:c-type cytochrome [Candidatus Seribacter sulfatis]|jgi:putative heme-binding domain-containing protein|uniref:c-type cytochrome n=1 Tax=Candidatus Seribacter sulfatis TaxID=3381756 RepID=UPI00389AA15A